MKNLMFVVILIACVASGCAGRRIAEAGSKGDSATSRDAKADVIEASHKFLALQSVAGKLEAVAETPFTQHVEYVAPDRYHVVYRDESGVDLDMIMAGDVTYVKSGDAWNEVPGETNPTPRMRNSFTDEVLETMTDPKFEGEDTIEGAPVYIYSYNLVTKIGNFPVRQRIWVSKDTGVPVKCYVEYSSGPIKNMTTTFDTKTPIAVELPPK